jgi:hypothetical protein
MGSSWYNGSTIDSTNLGGTNLEGKTWVFEDTDFGTGFYITVQAVRNAATFNLLPGRIASYQSTYYGRRVDGYTTTTAAAGFPIDWKLPSAGVPQYDLFYLIVSGPAKVYTDIASGTNTVVNVGDSLVALTAVTSGATTSGHAYSATGNIFASAATQPQVSAIQNTIGRALSASTTANTNTQILCLVNNWLNSGA